MSTNTDYKTYQKIYQEKYARIKPIAYEKELAGYFIEKSKKDLIDYWNESVNDKNFTVWDFDKKEYIAYPNTNPCQEIVLPHTKIDENYIFGMLLGLKPYFYIETYYNEKSPRLSYRGSDMDLYAHIQISKDKAPYLNLYYGQSFIVKAKQIMLNNTTSLLDYLYAHKEVMERFIVSGDPRIVWCI